MSATPQGPGTPAPDVDPYAEWDAAYVLGALSPGERSAFEEHLAGCDRCRAAVAEVSLLPGLLAQVEPEDAARLAETPVLPAGPTGLRPVVSGPARRRRPRLSTALLGVAAALLLVLGGLGLGQLLAGNGTRGPEQLAFTALEPRDITANVRLVPISGGTQVQVECQYSGASTSYPATQDRYSVVVVDRAGHHSTIKEWAVQPDRVMRPSGTTPLRVSQIRDVEIWESGTNEPVLRATRS